MGLNNTIEKITFCIPSNSNLRYLKTCIQSIRDNSYRTDHEIIIFVDADNDGTAEWLSNNQTLYNYTFFTNSELNKFGIAKAYDFCIEKSTTDIFMIFHADMILGKNADYHALKHLKEKTVVSSTRIEPPLFPSAGEKIIQDFGLWPEDFKLGLFNSFVNEQIVSNSNKTTDGIFAPWMMYKKDFLNIGGHDHSLRSFKEDSDIFNRMVLNNYQIIQSWDSLVYHFCGRGGRFENGNLSINPSKIEEEQISERQFIRKWGSTVRSTPLLKPIIVPKYDVGIVIENISYTDLKSIEPYCAHIYYTPSDKEHVLKLIDEEKTCNINISSKFTEVQGDIDIDSLDNDIIVFSENNIFKDLSLIKESNFIISQVNQIGTFKVESDDITNGVGHIVFVIRKLRNTLIDND